MTLLPAPQVIGFDTMRESDDWLMANPSRAMGGLYFDVDTSRQKVGFVVQSNSTVRCHNTTSC